MAKRAFKQFNEQEIIDNCGYFRLPVSFCTEAQLPPSGALQAGLIFSYSNPRKGTSDCTRTHKGFSKELLISPATSARELKRIRNLTNEKGENILESSKQSSYRIDKSKINTRHSQIEKCILYHSFEFKDGSIRPLSKGALLLFSYIVYKYNSLKDKKKGVKATYKDFAKALGCCEKTIGKQIDELISCGLIFRGKDEEGLNGFKMSVYHPDSKLLTWIKDVRKQQIKARRKKAPEPDPQAEERARIQRARDKYYNDLQRTAKHREERSKEIANDDSEYVELNAELEALTAREGKYKNLSVMEGMQERIRIMDLISEALRRLGLNYEDLNPKPKCSKCNDTGYRTDSNKLCDCFPLTDFKDLLD